MNPDLWRRAQPLFEEGRGLAPEAWDGFLTERCGDNEDLRREVRALLEGDRLAPEGFLLREQGPPGSESLAGRSLGQYRLVRHLGTGGMGEVYLAERADAEIHKRVAVKVLRPALVSPDMARRFRTERQILASLEHASIARFLDAGTTDDGMLFLVMEYAEGQPIDAYCDSHRLSTDERLDLFSKVCDAVHFAHQNLVVHRDLKPANILITAEGSPKLLDFGIAKLLNPELSGTAATVFGRPMTPEYASPEQVRGEPVTIASDVYSLGVLLYHLLTGHLPYRITGSSPVEIERVICETEPERLSTAVLQREEVPREDGTTAVLTPESVSQTRDGDPARLRRRLAGDLDGIVLMALRKEPQRRYASVEQLAADIRRHRAGFPVLASGDSLAYRSRKFLRRHRLGVAFAGAIAVLVLGFGIAMGALAARLAAENRRAEVERGRAEEVTSFLTGIFEVSDPSQATGETVTAREVLDAGARKLTRELEGQPAVQAELMRTVGTIYRRLGLYDRASAMLEAALERRRRLFGEPHEKLAQSLNDLAILKEDQGDYPTAERLYRQALEMRRQLFGPRHLEVAQSLNDLAAVLWATGRYDEAEAAYRETLTLRRQLLGEEHPEVAKSLSNLGVVLWSRGRYREAEACHQEALAMRRRLFGEGSLEVADSLNNLAIVRQALDDATGAEAMYRQSLELYTKLLGERHPRVVDALNNLGFVLQGQGKYAEAEPWHRKALARRRELYGDDHPGVAQSLENLGFVEMSQESYGAAERDLREALAIRRKVFGEEHRTVADALRILALTLRGKGEPEAAEVLLRQVVEVRRRLLGEDHPEVADALLDLGDLLTAQGRYAEAEPLLLESYGDLRASQGASSATLRTVLETLVSLYDAWGRPEQAAQQRRKLAELAAEPAPG